MDRWHRAGSRLSWWGGGGGYSRQHMPYNSSIIKQYNIGKNGELPFHMETRVDIEIRVYTVFRVSSFIHDKTQYIL